MRPIFGALIFSIALILPAFAGVSSSRPDPDLPLEWQKIDLEDMLHAKINSALAQNIPDKYFNVTVGIALKPQLTPAERAKATQEKFSATEDLSKEEAPTPGKLGLDLSLLLLARQERNAKVEDTRPDLFRNIARIDVNILLDDKLPVAKSAVAQMLARGIVGSVANAPANINVRRTSVYTAIDELQKPPEVAQADDEDDDSSADRQPAATDAKADVAPEKPWDIQRWMVEMKYPAGILAAALLITLLGFFGFNGHLRLENRRLNLLEAKNQREEESFQREHRPLSTTVMAGAPPTSPSEKATVDKLAEQVEKGVERFRALLHESPDRAAQLVSQWVKSPKRGAAEALSLLPQILKIEELNLVFGKLSLEEKKEWRRFLSMSLDSGGIILADSYIASQIVENILVPGPKLDPVLRAELSELSLSDCVELVKRDVQLGAILTNVLSSGQVARIFAVLPVELASEVTLASVRISEDQIAQRGPKLRSAIAELKSGAKNVRFLDNPSELMRDVGPEREGAIFSALSDAGEYRLLEKVARQFYPAELITRLPSNVLKVCLDSIPLERRAELVFSRDRGEQQILLDTYGRDGSRLRELLDLEIERIESDDTRRKGAERHRNQLWKELADLCRNRIKTDPAATEIADSALNSWLYERSNGSVGGMDEQAA